MPAAMTAYTGIPTYQGGCSDSSDCQSGGTPCCGIVFTSTSPGSPQEVPVYVDVPTGGIAVPNGTSFIPPGLEDWNWIIPHNQAACLGAAGPVCFFDLVSNKDATAWKVDGTGGLTNGSCYWSTFYSSITANCGPVSTQWSFPMFFPVPNVPTPLTPTVNGWYYVRPTAAAAYVSVVQGVLTLTDDPSQEQMFFYDVASGKWAVSFPQPFAPTPNATSAQWISPTQYSSCSGQGASGSPLQLTPLAAVPNRGWVIYSDGVMRDAGNTGWYWTSTGVGSPITLFCGQSGSGPQPITFTVSPISPFSPNIYTYLNSIMVQVPPGTPDYDLCQGPLGGDSQACFYNHSATSPNVAVFPDISPNPNSVIGYAKASIDPAFKQQLGSNPTVYLQQPNDAMQLNSMQASICFDEKCACPGESPAQCATSPDGYCHCQIGSDDQVCGLSCAPGLEPYVAGACKYDPLHSCYIQHYQCFQPLAYGVTDASGVKSCVSYAGPNPPGQAFTSLQACYEQWADCPDGYQRYPQLGRPGCYRKKDYVNFDVCSSVFSDCDANITDCGNGWNAYAHGSCGFTCNCDCIDVRSVPPWGYWCADSDSGYGNKWVQNQSNETISAPSGSANFRVNNSPEAFCVPGTTPYAN